MLHLGYGATFTVPQVNYDAYGRVTGHTNRTVKIPAAPSGGSASALSNITTGTASSSGYTLPSGGTWAYCHGHGGYSENGMYSFTLYTGKAAGGTKITNSSGSMYIIFKTS